MPTSTHGAPAARVVRSYVLCATDRSGSTWLTHALRTVGSAGTPREYFSPWFQSQEGTRWSVGTFPSMLSAVVREGTTENGVFGAKLMWWQFAKLQAWARETPEFGDLEAHEILSKMLPNVRYVYLTRRNKLDQAISHLKAEQSGVWHHQRSRSRAPQIGLSFDYFALRRRIRMLEQCEVHWEDYFRRVNAEPLRLTYEDMTTDFRDVMRRVLEFLELPDSGAGSESLDGTLRIPDRVSSVWARKYARRERLHGALPRALHAPLGLALLLEGWAPRVPLGTLRIVYRGLARVPRVRQAIEKVLVREAGEA